MYLDAFLYYFLPYLAVVPLGFLAPKIELNSLKIILFVLLIPSFVIVVFRGAVGVDTATYEHIISKILLGEPAGVETGFVLLVRFVSVFF